MILNWFRINEMKSNDDKCHLIVANTSNVSVTMGSETIEISNSVKLLGINMDNGLNFNTHISRYVKQDM